MESVTMEHFQIDLHLDYGEENFDFGAQFSSGSSSRSFSTAPSCAPITPQSGRSTPHQHPSASVSLNHPSIKYELMPSGLNFDDYFSSHVKSEAPVYDEIPSTPSRKPMSPFAMDVLNASLPQYGEPMEFSNSNTIESFSFPDAMASSPFNVPPPQYPAHSSATYDDTSSMWAYQSDSPLAFLARTESPGVPPPYARRNPAGVRNTLLPPHVPSNAKRQMCMEDVQQKSMSLHRIQSSRTQKKGGRRRQQPGNIDIDCAPLGRFSCPEPICAGRKAYRRAEHLQRHMVTEHNKDPKLNYECQFCGKVIKARMDNFRVHVKRHTEKGSGNSRTNYFPGAQAVFDELQKGTRRKGKKHSELKMEEAE